MKLLSKITLFFFPLLLQAQSEQAYYQNKLDTYFTKDHEVKNFVSITESGIFIYANAEDKAKNSKPEIKLSWQQVDSLKNIISYIPEKELEKLLIDKKDSMGYYMQKDSVKIPLQLI